MARATSEASDSSWRARAVKAAARSRSRRRPQQGPLLREFARCRARLWPITSGAPQRTGPRLRVEAASAPCAAPLAGTRDLLMKLSARNMLKGKVVEVKKGQTTAHVRLDIGGAIITAAITNEAVEDLALAVGDEASAVIKASDVMIAKG